MLAENVEFNSRCTVNITQLHNRIVNHVLLSIPKENASYKAPSSVILLTVTVSQTK